jgi:hypothetical protein
LEYLKEYSLREFSYYIPEVKRIGLNLDSQNLIVPGKTNEFYINDDQGLEILNVKKIYPKMSDYLIHGMRPMGPLSYGEIGEWALANEMANNLKMFSSFDMTYEFIHPNIVRISPVSNNQGTLTLEYERIQNPDLSGIPNEFQILFSKFCLADTMIVLGRIRKKYANGNLRTQFGEIPLGDEIGEEGKELKREVIEKLEQGPLMNVIFDKG